MKIKCPVAGCDYIVKGADDGFKHWQKYDEFHKTLHKNWINAFFSEIANSDWSDEVKFRFAYKKWHENEKKQKIQAQKQKKRGQDTTDNITMKDGRVIYNGESYTPEQFANIQKGIKYMPVKMGK
jgi:hypothetical protein